MCHYSMIHTTVRLTEAEKKFIDDNYISLTKFVRGNLDRYRMKKESQNPQDPEIRPTELEAI